MDTVSKIIEYRQAVWFGPDANLESFAREAWQRRPTNLSRVVERFDGDSVMGMKSRDFGENGFAIHCSRYRNDQGVGVVSMAESGVSTVQSRRPGNEENYLNTDVFALINGNHVLTVNASMNGAGARSYLQGLFRIAELPDGSDMFSLERRADAEKAAMIREKGVARFDLKMSISDATANVVEAGQAYKSRARALKDNLTSICDIIGLHEETPGHFAASQKGSVKLSINVPEGDLVFTKDAFTRFSEGFVDEEEADGYNIVLRNNQTIKPSEIAIRSSVTVERKANTVDADDIWREMAQYMNELREIGQLDM